MAHHCLRGELAKTRYFVSYGPLTWQIDVYKGILAGVILAEVELLSEIVEPPIPAWVGREVTGNPDYKKINMVNARMAPTSPRWTNQLWRRDSNETASGKPGAVQKPH
jgi:adenylate cyclase